MRNVVITQDGILGYACGYTAWRKFAGTSNTDYYLTDGSFDVRNSSLALDKNTDVYILATILNNSKLKHISMNCNSITVIQDMCFHKPEVIADINNIVIVCTPLSTIEDCWNFFNDGEIKPLPKALELVKNMCGTTSDSDASNFFAGLKKLDYKNDFLFWNKLVENEKFVEYVIELGSKK